MDSTEQSVTLLAPGRPPAWWIGLPISLVIGLLFHFATAKSIESDSGGRFANHARNAQNTISARIKSYTDVLRGTASLFGTSEAITRDQFHAYVDALQLAVHFPAIESINFAFYVRDGEMAAFERRMAASRHPDEPPLLVHPAGRRAHYAIVSYIEPGSAWSATFGRDLLILPYVEKALMASRDTATLITSGQPIPAISGPKRIGLGMRLPIYRPGSPSATVEQRRAAYLGSVGIAFSVDKLVQGVIAEMPISQVRMTLVDGGLGMENRAVLDGKGERVLFDSGDSDVGGKPLPHAGSERFSIVLPVDFNGRLWRATFSTPKRAMYSGFDEYFPWLAMGAGWVSSMLIYALIHTLTSSRRRAIMLAKEMTRELRESQAKLQLSHQKLRRLAAHADEIKEGERKRIAREIHDDLGQNLLALRIEADMLTSRTGERQPRLHARARSTLSQIDATIKSVRQIINDLRPNVLDLGLSAAVEWQVSEFRRRTGIACALVDDHKEIKLSDSCATAFFRILQESLSNISRHARATEARVELRLEDGRLSMTVSDNGIGLAAGGRNKIGSFGLVGIEERIHILGGSCSIVSFPGSGTTVGVVVSAEPAPPADAAAAASRVRLEIV
ncbi:MAG TPA: CHASE domain-containing protein [Telluria sp.]|nr:CHASE domain-containing protein [Telluria sp.]